MGLEGLVRALKAEEGVGEGGGDGLFLAEEGGVGGVEVGLGWAGGRGFGFAEERGGAGLFCWGGVHGVGGVRSSGEEWVWVGDVEVAVGAVVLDEDFGEGEVAAGFGDEVFARGVDHAAMG